MSVNLAIYMTSSMTLAVECYTLKTNIVIDTALTFGWLIKGVISFAELS